MKKIKHSLFFCLLAYTSFVSAQFTPNGSNIYYNGGNVIIANSSETSAGIRFEDAQDPNGQFAGIEYNSSSNALTLNQDVAGVNTVMMSILASGNVGIGVTNPLAKLSIDGFVKIEGSDGRLMLQNPSSTASVYLRNSGISSQRKFEILFGGATKFTINNDGNVHVGSGISGNPNYNDVTIGNATSNRGIQIFSSGHSGISFHDDPTTSSTSRASYDGGIYYNHTDNEFQIWSNKQRRLTVDPSGNVGIGTANPDTKLTVKGTIHSEEVKVDLNVPAPDYVFEPNYELRTLKETKEYITKNKHLPEIPSAKEIGENGIDLGDMNMRLLKKIEELTLYQIELMEKLEKQNAELQEVKKEVQSLKE